jgi:hypothetical protein
MNILEEAIILTSGKRNDDYGPPLSDYRRTAALWTALLAHKLKPGESIGWDDAIRCMCAVKLSRDVHKRSRDNMVDLAGYAQCRQLAHEADKTDLSD